MVFLGGAVLANIVSLPQPDLTNQLDANINPDGGQRGYVGYKGRVGRARRPVIGEVGSEIIVV